MSIIKVIEERQKIWHEDSSEYMAIEDIKNCFQDIKTRTKMLIGSAEQVYRDLYKGVSKGSLTPSENNTVLEIAKLLMKEVV